MGGGRISCLACKAWVTAPKSAFAFFHKAEQQYADIGAIIHIIGARHLALVVDADGRHVSRVEWIKVGWRRGQAW
jgi:hypothetical protein